MWSTGRSPSAFAACILEKKSNMLTLWIEAMRLRTLPVSVAGVLAGIACGMALAVSGAVIQGVLANRLASPSIIGVNAGAGLAVTLCSAFGLIAGWKLSLFSFAGAFLSFFLKKVISLASMRTNVLGTTAPFSYTKSAPASIPFTLILW